MEQQLKQRLLGTVIVISTAVIVLPLLLDGEGYRALQSIEIEAPHRPTFNYQQEGFITPLKSPNDGTLNPPSPIEIRSFEETMNNIESAEQNDVIDHIDIPSSEPSDSEPPATNPDTDSQLTTTWVVQVGSFSIEENASEVRKKLTAMDMKNTVTAIDMEKVGEQNIYVVKIISDNYEALSNVAEQIKKDYPDAFIKERE